MSSVSRPSPEIFETAFKAEEKPALAGSKQDQDEILDEIRKTSDFSVISDRQVPSACFNCMDPCKCLPCTQKVPQDQRRRSSFSRADTVSNLQNDADPQGLCPIQLCTSSLNEEEEIYDVSAASMSSVSHHEFAAKKTYRAWLGSMNLHVN
jgi:hypothetical protein